MKKILCAILFMFPLVGNAQRPNILLILADDLGYGDLSVQGCKQFKTPHIDSIAKKGVRFKQGYVSNSVCAPSRAGILSGRIGIGFESNLPKHSSYGLDPKLTTMPDHLKRAGYKTFCIGKWHLGAEPQFHPNQRGFDEFYGLLGGSRSYFALDNPDREIAIERNGVVEKDPSDSYMTDRLTDGAIDYINAHVARKIKPPFFMYLSYTAPHGPLEAKPGYAERFSHIEKEKRRAYAGLVASLDEGVGRVLECLEDNGLEQDTLIVFLSDNGGPTDHNASWNGPLKGAKGSLWEGGVRVPFFMQWTGKIPAGQVLDEPVSSLDLLPSFGAAAGVKYTIETDGINLWPYLGGTGNKIPDRTIFWRRGDKTSCALRQGQYKWVENRRTDEQWLFDIEADLSEKNNLLSVLPEMAETMKRTHMKWEASVPDPSFSSEWKPKKKAK